MILNIWNFIVGFEFNTVLAIWLYWVPLLVCLIGYLSDCVSDYKSDYERHTTDFYYPKLTVGKILGRLIVSFVPGVNIAIALFSHFFILISKFFHYLGKVFDIPLIPARPQGSPAPSKLPKAPGGSGF